MTRDAFKKDADKVAALRRALEANPIIAEAMQVNRDEGPVTDPVNAMITPTYANIALGMHKGYERAYWDLMDLTKPPADLREPEAKYEGNEEEFGN